MSKFKAPKFVPESRQAIGNELDECQPHWLPPMGVALVCALEDGIAENRSSAAGGKCARDAARALKAPAHGRYASWERAKVNDDAADFCALSFELPAGITGGYFPLSQTPHPRPPLLFA